MSSFNKRLSIVFNRLSEGRYDLDLSLIYEAVSPVSYYQGIWDKMDKAKKKQYVQLANKLYYSMPRPQAKQYLENIKVKYGAVTHNMTVHVIYGIMSGKNRMQAKQASDEAAKRNAQQALQQTAAQKPAQRGFAAAMQQFDKAVPAAQAAAKATPQSIPQDVRVPVQRGVKIAQAPNTQSPSAQLQSNPTALGNFMGDKSFNVSTQPGQSLSKKLRSDPQAMAQFMNN